MAEEQKTNKTIAEKVEERLRQKQEGKEFKDTEGRIGGSKKERMAYKMVSISDLTAIEEDEATAIELVKKDKVYPKVDVTAEREKGTSSGCAFLKVKLREAVASAPPNNVIARKIYVAYATKLFEATQDLASVEEFDKFRRSITNNGFQDLIKILRPELIEPINEHIDYNLKEYNRVNSEILALNNRLEEMYELQKKPYIQDYEMAEVPQEAKERLEKQYFDSLTDEVININYKINDLSKERIKYTVNSSYDTTPDEKDFIKWISDKFPKLKIYGKGYVIYPILKEVLGTRFVNFIGNKGSAVEQTFNDAEDYEALSLSESIMKIESNAKNTKEWIEKQKKLLEEVKTLSDRQSHDEFFKENSRWSFGGLSHIFNVKKSMVTYSDAKNVEQIEAYKKRWISAEEKDLKDKEEKIKAIEHRYRVRENNWDWAFGEKGATEQKKKSELKVNTYPPLSYIKRTGGVKITEEDITPASIREKFGYKEVEFGQSLKDKEAKEHVRHFLSSMADLGEILNMDIAELNKLGGLSIAFASRGGGKASAHYEPLRKVINVTKTRGGGAIAHEYMHYLDNILPKINRIEEYKYTDWASVFSEGRYGYKSQHNLSNDNVFTAVKNIFAYIYRREIEGSVNELNKPTIKITIQANDKKYNLPKTFWSSGGGHVAPKDIEEYWTMFRDSSYGRSYKFIENLKNRDYEIIGSIVKLFGFNSYEFEFKTNKSIFYSSSLTMGSDYWHRAWELFARAFETYIYDKLDKAGRVNNYLVSGVYFDHYTGIYPKGEEREALFELYDDLMKTIKSEYKINDFVAWTAERVDEYIALETDEKETTKTGVIVDAETNEVEEVINPDADTNKVKAKLKKLLDLLTNEEMEAGGLIQNNTQITDKLNEFLLTLPN